MINFRNWSDGTEPTDFVFQMHTISVSQYIVGLHSWKSAMNNSGQQRCGYVVHYITTAETYATGCAQTPDHLRLCASIQQVSIVALHTQRWNTTHYHFSMLSRILLSVTDLRFSERRGAILLCICQRWSRTISEANYLGVLYIFHWCW